MLNPRRAARLRSFAAGLLRSLLDTGRYLAGERSYPLTLTLSLGERTQPPPGACSAPIGLANSLAGIANRRRIILPLLWGEGQGEGE